MVRHEAAEALGGIASDGVGADERDGDALPEGGVLAILREWAVKEDAPVVVRESCQVAIDMWEVSNTRSVHDVVSVGEGLRRRAVRLEVRECPRLEGLRR